MNPKFTRFALITAVLAIWGSILYKVIAGLNHDDKEVVVPMIKASFSNVNTDSFTLKASYADPFLTDNQLYEADISLLDSVSNQTTAPITTNISTITQSPIDVSFIKYTGLVSNPIKKSRVAFINVRGKDYMVKEKDYVDEIKITKITAEKIYITYSKKKFEIMKNN